MLLYNVSFELFSDVPKGTIDEEEIGWLNQELEAKRLSETSYEEKISEDFKNGNDLSFPSKCLLTDSHKINSFIKASEKEDSMN